MLKTALNSTFSFSWKLLLFLLIVLTAHLSVNFHLTIDSSAHLLPLSYVLNYLLVLVSYFIIILAKAKGSHSLGYLFLAGFFLKIAVFMIFFNPIYKADDQIVPQEFFAFFVSYVFCLAFETKIIVKILNQD
ncbi:MAG: hypothetical protein ACI9DK_001109 [Vicingaceae bacterium]|jgi:hypothetical protein